MRGALERDVLQVLWSASTPLTPRDVQEQVNVSRPAPLAYTTVTTVLRRLVAKGAVVRREVGGRFIYEATSENAAGLAVRRVVAEHGDAALEEFLRLADEHPALRHRVRSLFGPARPVVEPAPEARSWTEVYLGPSDDRTPDDWTRWITDQSTGDVGGT